MIRASQQAAYGLGYLASLTHTGNKLRDVDYAAQAKEDFAWYARMDERQLQLALDSRPIYFQRGVELKQQILQLRRDDALTYAQIAARVGCHINHVYKVVKEARQ